jgi:hypothetical protein
VKTRLVASVALAAALLVGASGCTLYAVQGTQVQYQPSDGAAANIGDLKLRNIIGLSDNGDDISLLLSVINSGDESASLIFQYDDANGEKVSITVEVPADSTLHIGSGGEAEAILREAGATVGGLIPVYVQYGTLPGKVVQVPILDGQTAAYADLLPGPAPTPTPTLTPTPEPTETAEG